MNSYQIIGQKDFMNQLLLGSLFDEYDLKEASIVTAVTWSVDGHMNQNYFQNEIEKKYIAFKDVKQVFYQMIRGKISPVSFHIVLLMNQEKMKQKEEEYQCSFKNMMIQNLVLNIKFENGIMQLITAVDYENFTLDRDFEKEWDQCIYHLLCEHGFSFR